MRNFFIIIILSFHSGYCFAQNDTPKENAYFFRIKENRLQLGYQNSSFLIADTMNKDVSKLDISYRRVSGGFHKSQEPYKSSATTLQTEGIYTFRKLKVAGSFLLDKQWDDSLKNNLNGLFDDATPYYYFANKAGTFERQNYKFKALASYELTQKISAGLGLDYDYHWSTGSVDPRPDVKIFTYILKPEFILKVEPHSFIGMQGFWGKGTENSDVKYKNANYGTSLLYPDRIFYMNHGYGYITMKDQSIYQRRRSYKGVSLNLKKDIGQWELLTSLSYMKRDDGNTKEKYATSHLAYYSKWHLETWNANMFLEKVINYNIHQWNINLTIEKGRDWDSIFNANNYQYNHVQSYIGYSYLSMKNIRTQYGIDVSVRYEQVEKVDLLQAHHINYSTIEPSMLGHLYHSFDLANRLSFDLGPSVVLPIRKNIAAPATQINVFTQNVVYPDYYYWASTAGKLSFEINWMSKSLLKRKECGFFANGTCWKQFSTSSMEFTASTKPSSSRFQWTTGFRMYL